MNDFIEKNSPSSIEISIPTITAEATAPVPGSIDTDEELKYYSPEKIIVNKYVLYKREKAE